MTITRVGFSSNVRNGFGSFSNRFKFNHRTTADYNQSMMCHFEFSIDEVTILCGPFFVRIIKMLNLHRVCNSSQLHHITIFSRLDSSTHHQFTISQNIFFATQLNLAQLRTIFISYYSFQYRIARSQIHFFLRKVNLPLLHKRQLYQHHQTNLNLFVSIETIINHTISTSDLN